ncbi:MAG: potassium channel family protein [Moraxellaceae bacterium]|nr:potassium channel family protein [Moraxellaceae bacterium]
MGHRQSAGICQDAYDKGSCPHEGLRLVTDGLMPRLHMHPRPQMLFVILGVFLLHLIEIMLFALCYQWMAAQPGLGSIAGQVDGSLPDYLYFSFATYSSLGLGDIYPLGPMRLLVGLEALIGLLMIGWSASYTYIAMERLWRRHAEHDQAHRQRKPRR